MASGAQGDTDGIITDINVTPLVDIILVLLIIFMITANLIDKQAIKVELPEAATGEAAESTTIALTLTGDGQLFLNGAPTDEEAVRSHLAELVKTEPKAQAIIAADAKVPHGDVVHLIDVVRQEGVFKFALNIDPIRLPAAPDAP
jgi:biopolymer transport protein ExbD